MKALEVQMDQLAQALHQRPQGTLPSDTQTPEDQVKDCKAIYLRSGKEIPSREQKQDTEVQVKDSISQETLEEE